MRQNFKKYWVVILILATTFSFSPYAAGAEKKAAKKAAPQPPAAQNKSAPPAPQAAAAQPPTLTLDPAVQQAAEQWLKLIDKGNTHGSWQNTATLFQRQVTETQWDASIKSVRETFGLSIARQMINAQMTKSLPGAPDGDYVILSYHTAFEKKEASTETLTLMLDIDGQWHVAGYFIR